MAQFALNPNVLKNVPLFSSFSDQQLACLLPAVQHLFDEHRVFLAGAELQREEGVPRFSIQNVRRRLAAVFDLGCAVSWQGDSRVTVADRDSLAVRRDAADAPRPFPYARLLPAYGRDRIRGGDARRHSRRIACERLF